MIVPQKAITYTGPAIYNVLHQGFTEHYSFVFGKYFSTGLQLHIQFCDSVCVLGTTGHSSSNVIGIIYKASYSFWLQVFNNF